MVSIKLNPNPAASHFKSLTTTKNAGSDLFQSKPWDWPALSTSQSVFKRMFYLKKKKTS